MDRSASKPVPTTLTASRWSRLLDVDLGAEIGTSGPRQRQGRGRGRGYPRRAPVHPRGCASLRRGDLGEADRRDRQREGRDRLRAEGLRDPHVLVTDGHKCRGQQVLPRQARHAGSRDQRQADDRAGRRHHRRSGAARAATSPTETDAQAFQDELTHLLLHQKMSFNSPVWFNLGVATEQAASVGVFHQQCRGHDGLDPHAGQDRGHALQVRQRHGHEPLARSARRRSRSPAAAPPAGRCPS